MTRSGTCGTYSVSAWRGEGSQCSYAHDQFVSCDADCVGAWSRQTKEWTSNPPLEMGCGEYSVLIWNGNGAACEFSHGDTRECDLACNADFPSTTIDHLQNGAIVPCGNYTISQSRGINNACPYLHNRQLPCDMACAYDWNNRTLQRATAGTPFEIGCGTYVITDHLGNAQCDPPPGDIQEGDTRPCDVDCVGDWSEVGYDLSAGKNINEDGSTDKGEFIGCGMFTITEWSGSGLACTNDNIPLGNCEGGCTSNMQKSCVVDCVGSFDATSVDRKEGGSVNIDCGTYNVAKWQNAIDCHPTANPSGCAQQCSNIHGDTIGCEVPCTGAWSGNSLNRKEGQEVDEYCGTYSVSAWTSSSPSGQCTSSIKTDGTGTIAPVNHGDTKPCNEDCEGFWPSTTYEKKGAGGLTIDNNDIINCGTYSVTTWRGTGAVCTDSVDSRVLNHGDTEECKIDCVGSFDSTSEVKIGPASTWFNDPCGTYSVTAWRGDGTEATCQFNHLYQKPCDINCVGSWSSQTTNKKGASTSWGTQPCGNYIVTAWRGVGSACVSAHGDTLPCNTNCVGDFDSTVMNYKINQIQKCGTYIVTEWLDDGTSQSVACVYLGQSISHGFFDQCEVDCTGAYPSTTLNNINGQTEECGNYIISEFREGGTACPPNLPCNVDCTGNPSGGKMLWANGTEEGCGGVIPTNWKGSGKSCQGQYVACECFGSWSSKDTGWWHPELIEECGTYSVNRIVTNGVDTKPCRFQDGQQRQCLHHTPTSDEKAVQIGIVLGVLAAIFAGIWCLLSRKKQKYVLHKGKHYEKEEFERAKILGTLPGTKKKKIGNKKYSLLA